MPKKRKARDNKKLAHRTLTGIFHAVYEPEVSEAIYNAAQQQIAVRNLTTEHLIAHGPSPVRVTPKTPNALFGQYQTWRETRHPWLNNILQVIWRPAVEDAADACNKWEQTNEDHCVDVAKALEAGKKPKGNKKPKGIPKHVQKRRPDPKTLFVSRQRRDREHRHTLRDRRTSAGARQPNGQAARHRRDPPQGVDPRRHGRASGNPRRTHAAGERATGRTGRTDLERAPAPPRRGKAAAAARGSRRNTQHRRRPRSNTRADESAGATAAASTSTTRRRRRHPYRNGTAQPARRQS